MTQVPPRQSRAATGPEELTGCDTPEERNQVNAGSYSPLIKQKQNSGIINRHIPIKEKKNSASTWSRALILLPNKQSPPKRPLSEISTAHDISNNPLVSQGNKQIENGSPSKKSRPNNNPAPEQISNGMQDVLNEAELIKETVRKIQAYVEATKSFVLNASQLMGGFDPEVHPFSVEQIVIPFPLTGHFVVNPLKWDKKKEGVEIREKCQKRALWLLAKTFDSNKDVLAKITRCLEYAINAWDSKRWNVEEVQKCQRRISEEEEKYAWACFARRQEDQKTILKYVAEKLKVFISRIGLVVQDLLLIATVRNSDQEVSINKAEEELISICDLPPQTQGLLERSRVRIAAQNLVASIILQGAAPLLKELESLTSFKNELRARCRVYGFVPIAFEAGVPVLASLTDGLMEMIESVIKRKELPVEEPSPSFTLLVANLFKKKVEG